MKEKLEGDKERERESERECDREREAKEGPSDTDRLKCSVAKRLISFLHTRKIAFIFAKHKHLLTIILYRIISM